jgi:hypothetical protein
MPQCPVARLWRVVELSPVAELKILCENSQRVRTRNATACYGCWTKWKQQEREGSSRCTLAWQLLPATHDAACHAGKSHYGWSAMGPSSNGRKGRYGSLTVTRRKDATPSVVSRVRGKVFPLASARRAVFGSPLSPRGFTPKTPGVPSLTHPQPLHSHSERAPDGAAARAGSRAW